MKSPVKLLHVLFFTITFIWLVALVFYQVFVDFRYFNLKHLRYQTPSLVDPTTIVDESKIKVVCDPVCFFLVGDKRIRSRTDSDAGGGLEKVKLRFFDQYRGLIGYEDDNSHPNFFVIDTNGEFLQAVRLKLDKINFTFQAYYPSFQLIQFLSSSGEQYFYSANKPELNIL